MLASRLAVSAVEGHVFLFQVATYLDFLGVKVVGNSYELHPVVYTD